MKDTIKIVLLAIIAGTLLYQTIGQRSSSIATFPASSTAATPPKPAANPYPSEANKNTFDPLTPPTAPPVDKGPKTSIAFPVMEHDFGKVKQDSENHYVFKFTNTGKEPLMISNAQGSCGCTVPEYPKEPIAPGATGEIRVEYKPGKQEGNQAKTVTVTANTEPAQTILRIKADVQKVG